MAITVGVGTNHISLFVINKRYGPPCQLRNVLLDGLYLLHHIIDILAHPLILLLIVSSIALKRQAALAASPRRRPLSALDGCFGFTRQGRTGGYRLTEQNKQKKLKLPRRKIASVTSPQFCLVLSGNVVVRIVALPHVRHPSFDFLRFLWLFSPASSSR